MQAKTLELTHEKKTTRPKDHFVFLLIGDDNKIISFITHFQTYVMQINFFMPQLEIGLPSKIIFRTRHSEHHITSGRNIKGNAPLKVFDNQCDVNAVICFDLSEEFISRLKSRIGYKKFHPFFISYDRAGDMADPVYMEGVINAETDFNPYVFIKEIIDDFLLELEFKNDFSTFKFFISKKNIKSQSPEEISKRLSFS